MKIVSFGDVHKAIGQMNKIALKLATASSKFINHTCALLVTFTNLLVLISSGARKFSTRGRLPPVAISLFTMTMIRWVPN